MAEDDDVPALSAETFAALQEFYSEQAKKQEIFDKLQAEDKLKENVLFDENWMDDAYLRDIYSDDENVSVPTNISDYDEDAFTDYDTSTSSNEEKTDECDNPDINTRKGSAISEAKDKSNGKSPDRNQDPFTESPENQKPITTFKEEKSKSSDETSTVADSIKCKTDQSSPNINQSANQEDQKPLKPRMTGSAKRKFRFWIKYGLTEEEALIRCRRPRSQYPEYQEIKTKTETSTGNTNLESLQIAKMLKQKSNLEETPQVAEKSTSSNISGNTPGNDNVKNLQSAKRPRSAERLPDSTETSHAAKRPKSDDENNKPLSRVARKRLKKRYGFWIKLGFSEEEAAARSKRPFTDFPEFLKIKVAMTAGTSQDAKGPTTNLSDKYIGTKQYLRLPRKTTADSCDTDTNYIKVVLKDIKRDITVDMRQQIEEEILRLIDSSSDTGPSFVRWSLKEGCLILTCRNTYTRNWLKKHIGSFKLWEGAALRLTDYEEFPKNTLVVAKFPCQVDSNTLLNRLDIQNTGVGVKRWKVLSVKQDKYGQTVCFSLDSSSLAALKKVNYSLCFGMSAIQVMVREADDKNISVNTSYSSKRRGRSAQDASNFRNLEVGNVRSQPGSQRDYKGHQSGQHTFYPTTCTPHSSGTLRSKPGCAQELRGDSRTISFPSGSTGLSLQNNFDPKIWSPPSIWATGSQTQTSGAQNYRDGGSIMLYPQNNLGPTTQPSDLVGTMSSQSRDLRCLGAPSIVPFSVGRCPTVQNTFDSTQASNLVGNQLSGGTPGNKGAPSAVPFPSGNSTQNTIDSSTWVSRLVRTMRSQFDGTPGNDGGSRNTITEGTFDTSVQASHLVGNQLSGGTPGNIGDPSAVPFSSGNITQNTIDSSTWVSHLVRTMRSQFDGTPGNIGGSRNPITEGTFDTSVQASHLVGDKKSGSILGNIGAPSAVSFPSGNSGPITQDNSATRASHSVGAMKSQFDGTPGNEGGPRAVPYLLGTRRPQAHASYLVGTRRNQSDGPQGYKDDPDDSSHSLPKKRRRIRSRPRKRPRKRDFDSSTRVPSLTETEKSRSGGSREYKGAPSTTSYSSGRPECLGVQNAASFPSANRGPSAQDTFNSLTRMPSLTETERSQSGGSREYKGALSTTSYSLGTPRNINAPSDTCFPSANRGSNAHDSFGHSTRATYVEGNNRSGDTPGNIGAVTDVSFSYGNRGPSNQDAYNFTSWVSDSAVRPQSSSFQGNRDNPSVSKFLEKNNVKDSDLTYRSSNSIGTRRSNPGDPMSYSSRSIGSSAQSDFNSANLSSRLGETTPGGSQWYRGSENPHKSHGSQGVSRHYLEVGNRRPSQQSSSRSRQSPERRYYERR